MKTNTRVIFLNLIQNIEKVSLASRHKIKMKVVGSGKHLDATITTQFF